jgi:hypothetical protein
LRIVVGRGDRRSFSGASLALYLLGNRHSRHFVSCRSCVARAGRRLFLDAGTVLRFLGSSFWCGDFGR